MSERDKIAGIIAKAADKYRGLENMGAPTTQDYAAADALIAEGYGGVASGTKEEGIAA